MRTTGCSQPRLLPTSRLLVKNNAGNCTSAHIGNAIYADSPIRAGLHPRVNRSHQAAPICCGVVHVQDTHWTTSRHASFHPVLPSVTQSGRGYGQDGFHTFDHVPIAGIKLSGFCPWANTHRSMTHSGAIRHCIDGSYARRPRGQQHLRCAQNWKPCRNCGGKIWRLDRKSSFDCDEPK